MRTLIALACVAFLACTLFHGPAWAASDQKEVVNRVELNNAKVEQIVSFGVVTEEEAKKIVNLRDDLGGFQSYEDLLEVLPKEKVEKLKPYTTIKGIASDCTC
ncbi:MAG: helix-hairpin-helix domain-containing protein [Syntrophobacter sp.]